MLSFLDNILAIGGQNTFTTFRTECETEDNIIYDCERVLSTHHYVHPEVQPIGICNEGLSFEDLPETRAGGTAAFIDGRIVYCGGFWQYASDAAECFALNVHDDQWEEIGSLPQRSRYHQSSIIDGKWFLSGGTSFNEQDLFTAENTTLIFEDGLFNPGPLLPFPMARHCQVTIDDNYIFFAAGFKGNAAFLLDWSTQE